GTRHRRPRAATVPPRRPARPRLPPATARRASPPRPAGRPRRARARGPRSRLQHPPGPAAVGAARVEPALVQTEAGAVPELERLRRHADAAPARRTRHRLVAEARLDLGQARLELFARGQRLRLPRGPGAELAHARAAGEVGIG